MIPYGHNSKGEEYTVEEADPKDLYFCPKCGYRLVRRWGDINVHHFAHHPSYDPSDCPWRTWATVTEDIEKMREDAISYNTHRIRLFIEKSPYSSELVLYGSIPALKTEDIARMRQSAQQLQIDSVGTDSQDIENQLLPSNGIGWIRLDPSAQSYEINISPTTVFIEGSWRARGLKSNDFFVGSAISGEFVENPRYLARGDSVYIISPTFSEDLPEGAERLHLGAREVVRVEVSDEVVRILMSAGHELFVDNSPMRVDAIYPFMVNPRAQRFGCVQGLPGSEALVAVILPSRANPDLELLPIPFFKGDCVLLHKTDSGKPRFFRVSLDKMQSKRLLIHWPGNKYRDTLLDFSLVPTTETRRPSHLTGVAETEPEPFSSFEFGVEARAVGTIQKALAMFSQRLELHPITADLEEPVLPTLRLLCPKGFRVKLEAEHPGPDCRPVWVSEGEIDSNGFPRLASSTLQGGARTLRVHFASLGTVEIGCNYFYQQVLDRQIMKASEDYLDRLDQLPRSVYRSFVEKILNLIGVTNYSELEFNKWRRRIRKKIRALRKQRHKQRIRSWSSGASPNKLPGGVPDE